MPDGGPVARQVEQGGGEVPAGDGEAPGNVAVGGPAVAAGACFQQGFLHYFAEGETGPDLPESFARDLVRPVLPVLLPWDVLSGRRRGPVARVTAPNCHKGSITGISCVTSRSSTRIMESLVNLTLWIAAGLLAVVALTGGISKTFVPIAKLAAHNGGEWTGRAPAGFVRTLGILELMAATGLIIPAAVDVAPVMVPVTAVCWVLLMVGAMITHGRFGQFGFVVLNAAYLAVAAFIAVGRFTLEPFTG
ncbi:DoxX family protein [Actinomadura sp. B10D3]|uniref:DoxX family protein n=1 Tax=Actinomadura sp. B10D3 TaxID=3153557 RepID=UPI00325E24AB